MKPLLESAFDIVPIALVLTDSFGQACHANLHAKSILGEKQLEQLNLVSMFDKESQGVILNELRQTNRKTLCIESKLSHFMPEKFFELTLTPHPDNHHFTFWCIQDITKQKNHMKNLENLAYFDCLTGAYTRHYFFHLAEMEMQIFQKNSRSTSVLLLDLDNFKQINDTYGHSTGDMVLEQFGALVSRKLRKSDVFGRIGGEEFAIFLPNTPQKEALSIAKRICRAVEAHFIRHNVTVSIGLTSIQNVKDTLKSALTRADNALYDVKHHGKNGVKIKAMSPFESAQ